MKIINLKIAIVEHDEVIDKHKPLGKFTSDDLSVDINYDDFDLVLLEGSYKFNTNMWKNEKDELLDGIIKLLKTDKTGFTNIGRYIEKNEKKKA